MSLSLQRRTKAIALGGTIGFHLLILLLLSGWEVPAAHPGSVSMSIEIVPLPGAALALPAAALRSTSAASTSLLPSKALATRHLAPAYHRVLYSVRWPGGGTRRKVSGALPHLQLGVNVEALVRLELLVTGSGVVRNASVLQKGNALCDDAALREVRHWKFEPLPRRLRSVDQRCSVMVSFLPK